MLEELEDTETPAQFTDTPLVHIVDDDADCLSVTQLMLASSGHDVLTYSSPLDFLEGFRSNHPQCLLLDIRLPRMSGLELHRRLPLAIPTIVITGFASVQTAVQAFRQGVDDFLEKPFNPEALLDAVGRALDKDRAHQSALAQKRRAVETLNRLTAREREVLEHVVGGAASKVIASRLQLSKKTVDLHRSNIMRKTCASGAASLTRLWLLANGG